MRVTIAWPSSLPKKYSVNPNGRLKLLCGRAGLKRDVRGMAMAVQAFNGIDFDSQFGAMEGIGRAVARKGSEVL